MEKNYIDPKRFTELLLTYQQTEDEETLEILIRNYFYPLSCAVIRKFRFKCVDPEDALQVCVISCMNQIHRFNPNHVTTNPKSSGDRNRKAFSFFTTCVMNTYKGLYRESMADMRGKKMILEKEVDAYLRTNSNIKKRRGDEISYENTGENFEIQE